MRNLFLFLVVSSFTLALPLTSILADANQGKEYFESMNGGFCTSCHRVDDSKMVGPGLAGVSERHSEEWLRLFLSDPRQTWKSDHPETIELKERVRKTRAPVTTCKKNPMTSEQLDNLIDYLKTL